MKNLINSCAKFCLVSMVALNICHAKENLTDNETVTKATINLTTLVADMGAYFTSRAEFAKNIKDMTDIRELDPNSSGHRADFLVKNQRCLEIFIKLDKPNHLALVRVSKGKDKDKKICKELIKEKTIQDYLNATFTHKDANGKKLTKKGFNFGGPIMY